MEITQKRLEAIQELVLKISQEIRVPLDRMRNDLASLMKARQDEALRPYLNIITDNLARIEKKILKLKDLKTDKTVQYIKDIRMFDLSE
jgi:signal transduction histidine kinase